jgi:hypothetical protein
MSNIFDGREVIFSFTNVQLSIRVARWLVLKPKIPIWVKSGGPWNRKCYYIL